MSKALGYILDAPTQIVGKIAGTSKEGQSPWVNFRDSAEFVGPKVANYFLPGISAAIDPFVSKGAQEANKTGLGQLANLGSGLAGGMMGNMANYGTLGDMFSGGAQAPAFGGDISGFEAGLPTSSALPSSMDTGLASLGTGSTSLTPTSLGGAELYKPPVDIFNNATSNTPPTDSVGNAWNYDSNPYSAPIETQQLQAVGNASQVASPGSLEALGPGTPLNFGQEQAALTSSGIGFGNQTAAQQPSWGSNMWDKLKGQATEAAGNPVNWLKGAGSLYDMYSGNKQSGQMAELAKTMQAGADPFGSQRAGYGQRLNESYANPMGSAENQGLMQAYQQAANRSAAARGMRSNPIHAQIAMNNAMLPQLNAQRAQLGGFAGAGINPQAAQMAAAKLAMEAGDLGRKSNAAPLYALGDIFNPKSDAQKLLELKLMQQQGGR